MDIIPGQRLQQDEIAEELGISSTPVREALRRLEAEGLVTHQLHKGITVREARPDDVTEVYMLRSLLEGFATRLAAHHLTDEQISELSSLHDSMGVAEADSNPRELTAANSQWHMLIYEAAGSELLLQMVRRLWAAFPWDTLWVITGRPNASLAEHARILTALMARDGDGAERAMIDHIKSAERSVLAFIANSATQTMAQPQPS
jgi:DNA-binding GntR family transcriptional regulator